MAIPRDREGRSAEKLPGFRAPGDPGPSRTPTGCEGLIAASSGRSAGCGEGSCSLSSLNRGVRLVGPWVTAATVPLLAVAMAAVPTAAAATASAGQVSQEVDGCAGTGEAPFTLDPRSGLAGFETVGACGSVVVTFSADACDTWDNGRLWCDTDLDSGAHLKLTLGPDGGFDAAYASDSVWTITAESLDRVDVEALSRARRPAAAPGAPGAALPPSPPGLRGAWRGPARPVLHLLAAAPLATATL